MPCGSRHQLGERPRFERPLPDDKLSGDEASCCPPPDLGEPMLAGEAMSGERMLHGVDGASPSPRSPGRRNAAGGEPSSLIDGPGACA
jgi:hypothetical protein